MINIKDISFLEGLIGKRIKLVGSTNLHVTGESIVSYEMNMLICYEKNCILFTPEHSFGFFENEDGDVFYDYKIETGSFTHTHSRKSTVAFNSSEIIKAEIYGREFNSAEFVRYPYVYERVKGEEKTNDLFFFTCKGDNRLMLVFHPFMPGLELIYKQNAIDVFLNQYGHLYKLYHSITFE